MNDETHSTDEITHLKQGLRATWMAGDFGVIARTNASVAADFAGRLHVPSGSRVLDVATGTGNVAVPLAAAGYRVTGVDIAANLLEQAAGRARNNGLAIQFDEGDAEALPYADESFDAVVSMFGVMFAPRPALAVSEMARVLRPGGHLLLANWTPESFSGAMFRTGARHLAPPPGVPSPVLWGVAATAQQLLAQAFDDVRTTSTPIDWELPTSPAGAVELFRTYFGPTRMTFARLDGAGQAAFAADLLELWTTANIAEQPERHTLIRNEYLQVEAIRR